LNFERLVFGTGFIAVMLSVVAGFQASQGPLVRLKAAFTQALDVALSATR
jgi:hypothetical protein